MFGFDWTALFRPCRQQRSLLDLPPELRDEVISHVLARVPTTRISLLLASKAVNASTHVVVRRGLVVYVTKRYGDHATMLFLPKAQSMGREEYLGKVHKVMVSIGRILKFAKRRLEKYVDQKVEGWETIDVDQAVKVMRVGLFTVEAVQWDRTITSKARNVREMLTWLPLYGALILRVTSLLVALTFRKRICREVDALDKCARNAHGDRRSETLGLDRDTVSMTQAVETELLLHGCQGFGDMVAASSTPGVSATDFPNFLEYLFALAKESEEFRKQKIARTGAVERFLETMELVGVFSRRRPGRLWEERIEKHFRETVPLFSMRLQHVKVLQEIAMAEFGEDRTSNFCGS